MAGVGEESAIRSNRLDVCVYEVAASECPPPPAEDLVRVPPPPGSGGEEGPEEPGGASPTGDGPGSGGGQAPPATTVPAVAAGRLRLQLSRLDRSRLAQGLVRVGWWVRDSGPGVGKWTVSSLTLGRKGARYVSRASGRSGNAARCACLPATPTGCGSPSPTSSAAARPPPSVRSGCRASLRRRPHRDRHRARARPRPRYRGRADPYELTVQRRLDRTRLLVRAGPALGLMGR